MGGKAPRAGRPETQTPGRSTETDQKGNTMHDVDTSTEPQAEQAARLAGVRRNLILLREAREAAGLPQRYVADLCAVSVSAVSRWESGDRCPSGMTALALAQVLTDLGVNIYAP